MPSCRCAGMEGSAVLDVTGTLRAVLLPCLYNSTLGAFLFFAVPIEALLTAMGNQHAHLPHYHPATLSNSGSSLDAVCSRTAYQNKPQETKSQAHPAPMIPSTTSAAAVLEHACDASHVACNHTSFTHNHKSIRDALYSAPGEVPIVPKPSHLEAAQRAVVLVRLASGWASGVIVDTRLGLVLTNAHVFDHRGLQDLSSVSSQSREGAPHAATRRPAGVAHGQQEILELPRSCTCGLEHKQACCNHVLAPTRFKPQQCQVASTDPV